MTLKSAAFFALIGMTLLTVLLAVGFIRDVSALSAGAIAAIALLKSLIHLLASLSVAVFLFVFYKAPALNQSGDEPGLNRSRLSTHRFAVEPLQPGRQQRDIDDAAARPEPPPCSCAGPAARARRATLRWRTPAD